MCCQVHFNETNLRKFFMIFHYWLISEPAKFSWLVLLKPMTCAMLWDKACPGQPRSFNFPEIIAVGVPEVQPWVLVDGCDIYIKLNFDRYLWSLKEETFYIWKYQSLIISLVTAFLRSLLMRHRYFKPIKLPKHA